MGEEVTALTVNGSLNTEVATGLDAQLATRRKLRPDQGGVITGDKRQIQSCKGRRAGIDPVNTIGNSGRIQKATKNGFAGLAVGTEDIRIYTGIDIPLDRRKIDISLT